MENHPKITSYVRSGFDLLGTLCRILRPFIDGKYHFRPIGIPLHCCDLIQPVYLNILSRNPVIQIPINENTRFAKSPTMPNSYISILLFGQMAYQMAHKITVIHIL